MPETIKQALKAILGICLASFSIGFVFGLAFPLRVEAAVLSSYGSHSQVSNTFTGSPGYILLGTDYDVGTPTQFSFYAQSVGASTVIGAAATLRVCPSVNYSGSCYTYATGSNVTVTTAGSYVIPLSATSSIPSGKYLYFSFGPIQSGSDIKFYGSGTDVYPSAGSFCTGAGFIGTSQTCTTTDSLMKSAEFYLLSTPSLTTEGITSIITPTYASVVPSANNVHFSFSYNSYSYTRAGFTLVDDTTGQSIITSSASSTISSSGSGTFDGYLDLVSGHVYTWTPFLSESVYNSPITYGTPTMFFAVTNSSVYIPPAPTNPYATSSFGTIFNGIISTTTAGTTTINTGTSTNYTTGILDADLDNELRSRMPFSYIYDLLTVLSELASFTSDSSSPDAEYTLPFGKTANGSSTITIIDTSAVRDIEAVSQIRQLIAYTIYLMTAFAIAAAAASIL